jgi:hypothetical protein
MEHGPGPTPRPANPTSCRRRCSPIAACDVQLSRQAGAAKKELNIDELNPAKAK